MPTARSVRSRLTRVPGEVNEVDTAKNSPNPRNNEKIEEPINAAMIITNEDSIGGILQLCQEKRGTQKKFEYLSPTRVMLTYELPLKDRKSTRLNSSHSQISYAVFCLKKKKNNNDITLPTVLFR